jgi:CRISPR-associated protein Cmr5
MKSGKQESRPTLDQQRAKHAWEAVQRAKAAQGPHDKQSPKKFGGQAKKLPIRIMASGLGQALAFLAAKGDAPGLIVELSSWVNTRIKPSSGSQSPLLDRIIQGDSDFLRRATDEVLAYLQWLTRFAEAEGLTEETNP